MSDEKPIREYDRFIIRLPDGMKDLIAQRATENQRSMNSEIIAILEAELLPEEKWLRNLRIRDIALRAARMEVADHLRSIDEKLAKSREEYQQARQKRPASDKPQ